MTTRTVTGVLGLAVDDKGQYLLTKRHEPQHTQFHLKWNIPGGGMEFGEQPEETLTRELQEELQVTPKVLYPTPSVFSYVQKYPVQTVHVTLLCYLISIGDQAIVLDMKENVDFRWVTLEEVNNLDCLPGTQVMMYKVHELHIHNTPHSQYNRLNR